MLLMSANSLFAVSIDMPQKSGTRGMHSVWAVTPHSGCVREQPGVSVLRQARLQN